MKIYAAVMTLAFVGLFLFTLIKSNKIRKFQEIDVERINIVDGQGKRHLVITNPERCPDPVVNGEELTGKRTIKPSGLIFYNAKGNEVGGLATAPTPGGKVSLMAFDWAKAEAIGFNRWESDDGKKHLASFLILDPPPPGVKITEAAGRQKTRIAIQDDNKDARIILSDAEGKERIKLLVDRKGEAGIQILDRKGRVVFSAPKGE